MSATALHGLIITDSYLVDDETHDDTITMTDRYLLTVDHAASSYGIPVLVRSDDQIAFGPSDMLRSGLQATTVVERRDNEALSEILAAYPEQYTMAMSLIDRFCGRNPRTHV